MPLSYFELGGRIDSAKESPSCRQDHKLESGYLGIESGYPPPSRIDEPSIKAWLALWLVDKGATDVRISVDGAEVQPDRVRQIFETRGYSHEVQAKSRAGWTGTYTRGEIRITVVSRPGADVVATLPNDGTFMAECKGEPTLIGVRSGGDLTSLYNALGQLIRHAGQINPPPVEKAIVLPDTLRLRRIAKDLAQNPDVKSRGISILLVSAEGKVTEV